MANAKKNIKISVVIAIVAAVVVIAAAAVFVWTKYYNSKTKYEAYQFDTEAIEGRIQQMTEEEIQEQLNKIIEEGMFNIAISSVIIIEPDTNEGIANIENIPENRYHMQVSIYMDDTGEEIFTSKLIKPGYSMERIKLNRKLEPGIYTATAVFNAITQDKLQLLGTAAAEVNIYVLNDDWTLPRADATPAPEVTPAAEAAEVTQQAQ